MYYITFSLDVCLAAPCPAVLSESAGLVEEPVRGAAEGGFEGLLRGAGRGIAGFLVKPLTGVLDFAQKTAEAIKVIGAFQWLLSFF